MMLTPEQRMIGGAYSCFIIYISALVGFGMLFYFLMTLVVLNQQSAQWMARGFWWLFIFVPLAFILISIALACYLKNVEDENTKKRHMSVHYALERVMNEELYDSGIELRCGEYASWIEVINH
jgi:hypothetical protein